MQTGILYAIPCTLGSTRTNHVIPEQVKAIIASLEYFIVENEKSARHFFKNLEAGIIQANLKINVLDKHDEKKGLEKLLSPALEGKNMGLLSEAGFVAVADPGALIIELAHKKKIKVVPLSGPSSILLALMASGLNGQSFCFHGYLPKEKEQLKIKLKELENYSFKKNQTQVFIETPYRNMQLLEAIITVCEPSTLMCVATDITLDSEMISTKTISEWKKNIPDINKRPSVFLLLKK
ncbi:MAG TPA: SAM-dependent methyltransferase [Bacteroidia bacterium]|nr:SAM-dependent methyltransferase [Bacteroidia bacterium]